jgi:heme/copper-type cytochrome/quinol oxidase subunit 1
MSLPRAFGPIGYVVLGAVLVVAGIIAYAVEGPSSFGWFAYQPLGDLDGSYPVVLLTGHLWALGLGFVGSALLSGVLGYWLGRRRLSGTTQR